MAWLAVCSLESRIGGDRSDSTIVEQVVTRSGRGRTTSAVEALATLVVDSVVRSHPVGGAVQTRRARIHGAGACWAVETFLADVTLAGVVSLAAIGWAV